MDRRTWNQISKRLLIDVTPSRSNPRIPECRFDVNAEAPLNGITADLTKQHGGNVRDIGVVTITSKSVLNRGADAAQRNVAELTSVTIFNSDGDPNQWICWDFHGFCVLPTHYSIRTFAGCPHASHLVIESSVDGVTRKEINRQADTTVLAGSCALRTFPVTDSADCRFLRLTQTGTNALAFRAFEVFGTLRQ
jgi:hypothetical protein